MVKVKKRDAKADKTELRRHRFFNCALSGAPLCAPIVACRTGRLFNYEAVLGALLARRELPAELRHVQSAGDVFSVKFAPNPSYAHPPQTPVKIENDVSPWVCPVTGKSIGISPERFVANVSCGCVVAHDLVIHAPDATACHNCGAPSDESQIVELIVDDERMDELQQQLLQAQAEKKEKKRAKKKAKRNGDDEPGNAKKEKKARKERVEAPSISQKAAEKAAASTSRVSSLFRDESSANKLDNSKLFMRVGK